VGFSFVETVVVPRYIPVSSFVLALLELAANFLSVHLTSSRFCPSRELERLLPGIVGEALDIALEANRGGRVTCVEGFEYLYDEMAEDPPRRSPPVP